MGFFDTIFGNGQPGADPLAATTTPYQPTEAPQGIPLQGFAAAQSPVPPEIQQMQTPAKSPEELAQRVEGWKAALVQFNNNPNLQRAALLMGTSMMQPVQPGQTAVGQLGRSLDRGLAAYDFGNANALENQRNADKDARANLETEARTGYQTAQTDALKAKLPQEIANLEATGVYTEEHANWMRAQADLYPEKIAAELARDRKAGRASDAVAASAEQDTIKKQHLNAVWDTLTEEEKKDAAASGGAGRAGHSATVLAQQNYEKIWAQANPVQAGETAEAYAQRKARASLDYMTKVHGRSDQDLMFGLMTTGGMSQAEAQAALPIIKAGGGTGTPASTASGGDAAAWSKARNSVPVGGTYTGPDGKQYKRNK